MIELFEDPRQDKPSDQPAPASLVKFRQISQDALQGAGEARIKAQKDKGKMTARERISYLLDKDSFLEIKSLMETSCSDFGLKDKHIKGDGVITGFGRINGREVALFAQDFTQLGGSLGLAHATKIAALMDRALEAKIPVIGLYDSGGARIQEGVDSLNGYGEIFYRNVKASGVIPQISVILGPCAGGAAYSPALTDFIFMVEGISHMFITGPGAVKAATGEEVDLTPWAAPAPTAKKRRVPVCRQVGAGLLPPGARTALFPSPELRTKSPGRNDQRPGGPPRARAGARVRNGPQKAFRIHHVIWRIADDFGFFEIHQNFAKNVVTGFIRLGGQVVGVVANNPACLGGALDSDASDKAARFIRFLNAFNIPLLTLVDTGGYLPGVQQEHGGIIRHGAKLLYAYSEASIPKVTLVLRKAYGGAYIAMGSKYLRGDFNFAFPSAEIAVMGPRGAVEILYSRDLKAETDPAKKKP